MEDASEPQENRRKSGTGREVAVDIEAEIEGEARELLVLGGQRRPSQVSRRGRTRAGAGNQSESLRDQHDIKSLTNLRSRLAGARSRMIVALMLARLPPNSQGVRRSTTR